MTIWRWEEFSRCDKFPTTPGLINSQRLLPTVPIYQQPWPQGLLLCRTRRFFPSDGRNHRQYSCYHPTDGRKLGRPSWLGLVPWTVTHPRSNWARRKVTSLIWLNTLPLRHAANQSHRLTCNPVDRQKLKPRGLKLTVSQIVGLWILGYQ